MWMTVREKVDNRGDLDCCYLRGPPKGVGWESWRSPVQPPFKSGSSPTLHPVSDGFVWPVHENLQEWKIPQHSSLPWPWDHMD